MPMEVDQERLQRGRQLMDQARRLQRHADWLQELDHEAAHEKTRRSLRVAQSALDSLDGTDLEAEAHALLDSLGRYARERFPEGCQLVWTGERYEHHCPVAIGHKRFGFSPGMRVKKSHCSICLGDPADCPHRKGHKYDVTCTRNDGVCSVCHEADCTAHVDGETYNVVAVRVITKFEIDEVSLVYQPKNADARLTAVPIDTAELAAHLGAGFTPGMTVDCSRCLEDCGGLDFLDGDPRARRRASE